MDNDQVKVVVISTEEDNIWGYMLNVYIENKTDASMMVAVENVAINGYMEDPYWAAPVGANKVEFSSMYWDTDELESDGITTVETIEFTLYAYNDDDYSMDYYVDDTFTLNVQ